MHDGSSKGNHAQLVGLSAKAIICAILHRGGVNVRNGQRAMANGGSNLAIPESQLESWSKFVPSQISKETSDSIRTTLEAMESIVRSKDFTVYLQGSYKNDTNLRGDSDVDVVVELKSTFTSNAADLASDQTRLYHQSYPNATYHLSDFRRDVIDAMQRRYTPQKVGTSGDKAILVLGNLGSRLDADVIVCMEYRKYGHFYGTASPFVPGIKFWTQRENREVINYPKVHHERGCDKHDSTRAWFKRTVRTFKHARNQIVDNGWMEAGFAPSFFIESLIYNVPDDRFGGSYQMNFKDILEWLEKSNLNSFWCQNGQLPLFGPAREQWDEPKAQRFVSELRDLWELWS